MLTITALPAFNDNYIWLLQNPATLACAVVDPGDAAPVLQWLQQNPQWTLTDILVTHHHRDHTGGIAALKQATSARVYGPQLEAVEGIDLPLADEQCFQLLERQVRCLHVPGHTLGHVAYYMEDEPPVLFSGDTLFMAGCGRLFEGTPLQMYQSLQRLAALPAATRVYCTHEYSLSNLKFAAAAEPDNPQVLEQLTRVEGLRTQGRISLPGTIAQERAINPFLRCSQPTILATLARQNRLQDHDPVEVFTALRAWKDGFQA